MDQADFDSLMRSQNTLMRRVADENETDSKIKVMEIINDLVTDRNRKAHKEAIHVEAEMRGMEAGEVDRILESLKADGMIMEPEPGFVKRA